MTDSHAPPTLRPALGWFLLLDGGLVALGILALAPRVADRARRHVPLPPTSVLRAILLIALLMHISEGAAAWMMASRRGLAARRWAVQTAIVGFPSLRLLSSHPAAEEA